MLKSGIVIAASAALATLVTCKTADPPAATVIRHTRTVAPVTAVLASAEMSPDCRMATAHAVRHLVELGAKLTLVFVEEDSPAIALEPHVGQVAVHAGLPRGNVLAETYSWISPGGAVMRAEVIVAHCSVAAIVHELAHVVKYEGRVNYERMLHAEDPDWGLDPAGRP